jgi:hypothetical protein
MDPEHNFYTPQLPGVTGQKGSFLVAQQLCCHVQYHYEISIRTRSNPIPLVLAVYPCCRVYVSLLANGFIRGECFAPLQTDPTMKKLVPT